MKLYYLYKKLWSKTKIHINQPPKYIYFIIITSFIIFYQSSYANSGIAGKITNINPHSNEIQIGKTTYILSPSVIITKQVSQNSLLSEEATTDDLSTGKLVLFKRKGSVINKIKILMHGIK